LALVMVSRDPLLSTESSPDALDQEERWVNRLSSIKSLAFFLVLATAYGGALLAQAPAGPLPPPSPWRAAAECVLAAAMLVELAVDSWALPMTRREEEVFPLIRMAGRMPYLTTWILYCQTIEMVVSAAGEVLLVLGVSCPKLMTMAYECAIFAAAIGILLTLLFLKFNYFEEKWREEVAKVVKRSGVPYFHLSLLAHLPSLPVAVLDIAVVRNARFLYLSKLPLSLNVGLAFGFAASYFGLIHILWWASGYRNWPYPFLHDLDTASKRLAFFAVIFLAFASLVLPLHFAT